MQDFFHPPYVSHIHWCHPYFWRWILHVSASDIRRLQEHSPCPGFCGSFEVEAVFRHLVLLEKIVIYLRFDGILRDVIGYNNDIKELSKTHMYKESLWIRPYRTWRKCDRAMMTRGSFVPSWRKCGWIHREWFACDFMQLWWDVLWSIWPTIWHVAVKGGSTKQICCFDKDCKVLNHTLWFQP